MVGTLDTELVKFIENLNADVIGFLDRCYNTGREAIDTAAPEDKAAAIEKAIADYTALVKEISLLMSDNDPAFFSYSYADYPLLIGKYYYQKPGGVSASNFAAYVRSATSSTIVKNVDPDTGEELTYLGESYIYFDSPYGIYYKWLEKFGFLPVKKD